MLDKMLLIVVLSLLFISCNAQQEQDEPNHVFEIVKTEQEWKQELTPEEFNVLRKKGTERAFTGEYNKHHEEGTYLCAACQNEIFTSETKFESHSGWPSFYKPISEENVKVVKDYSGGMVRDEVVCGRCGSHLGHVFNDGPEPTGLRYCLNSIALDFKK